MAIEPNKTNEIGFVIEAKQYVLVLEGLPSARVNDIIVGEDGGRAIIRTLRGDRVTALLLDQRSPRAGDRYSFYSEENIYSLGEHLFGRVINMLGEPVDEGAPFPPGNTPLVLDVDAPGIDARVPISSQLMTGIMLVDMVLPIALGQRQLLFGPVRGGKIDFLMDVVLNQEEHGTICIWAMIGKSLSELELVSRRILGSGKNILIAALSDQVSSRVALAPELAFLIADYFQQQGRDVLIILDDLDVHAKYLREIELLENRLPGRESYPGDLFYQHAHLLERCGYFASEWGGGSITALPVIETDAFASLGIVSTNLMSCTDGHLAFLASLQGEGIYPAVSEEQSITRIGHNVQPLVQKQLSVRVQTLLARARRQRGYAEFGGQVSKSVESTLKQGEVIGLTLRQKPGERLKPEVQVPLLALTLTPWLLEQDESFLPSNKAALVKGIATHPELEELRQAALADTPLDIFLALLEKKLPLLETLCRT